MAELHEGLIVEARARNIDEVFYEAVITRYDQEKDTYDVTYDDGTDDTGILRSSIIAPSQRVTVAENDLVKVVDGHVWIDGAVREARFLSFQNTPEIVQAAKVIGRGTDGSVHFEHSTIAFDINQAMILVMAIAEGSQRQARFADHASRPPDDDPEENLREEDQQSESVLGDKETNQSCSQQVPEEWSSTDFKVCVLGGGAGCLSTAVLGLFPNATVESVELSQVVADASISHFGVPREDPRHTLHIESALEYDLAQSSYDLIYIDIADSSASEHTDLDVKMGMDISLPPKACFGEEFLRHKVLPALKPSGWVAMNILAGRVVLQAVVDSILEWTDQLYVIATDPNYVLVFSNPAELRKPIEAPDVFYWAVQHGLHQVCRNVLSDVARSSSNMAKSILLGFFSAKEFKEVLNDDNALV